MKSETQVNTERLLKLLEIMAIEPGTYDRTVKSLNLGLVWVSFFRFTNCIEVFEVIPGSSEHSLLLDAIARNKNSFLSKAADLHAKHKHNELRHKSIVRNLANRFQSELASDRQSSLTPKSRSVIDVEAAYEAAKELSNEVSDFTNRLYQRRIDRLHAISLQASKVHSIDQVKALLIC